MRRFREPVRRALEVLQRPARDEAIGVGRAVFVLCVLLTGMMTSCWPGLRGAARRGLSAEERLDQGNEGGLVLEQEGVAGVGVERELGSVDQAG